LQEAGGIQGADAAVTRSVAGEAFRLTEREDPNRSLQGERGIQGADPVRQVAHLDGLDLPIAGLRGTERVLSFAVGLRTHLRRAGELDGDARNGHAATEVMHTAGDADRFGMDRRRQEEKNRRRQKGPDDFSPHPHPNRRHASWSLL
jgi:hypothetical protein